MKIGLDFDGVFCNGAKLLSEGSQKLFGLKLPEDKTAEETLDKDQVSVLKDFVFENQNNNLKLEPVIGAVSSCKTLIKLGHELQIITKRNIGVKTIKNFCKTVGIDIPVIGLKPGQSKSQFCKSIDVFLDDSIDNLIALQRVVPNYFLFVWPYNQDSNIMPERRVHSWEEFMGKICQ